MMWFLTVIFQVTRNAVASLGPRKDWMATLRKSGDILHVQLSEFTLLDAFSSWCPCNLGGRLLLVTPGGHDMDL